MLLRFVAFSWERSDAQASEQVRVWRLRVPASLVRHEIAPGLWVAHNMSDAGPTRSWTLAHAAGLILGRVFQRQALDENAHTPIDFDAAATARILESGGRALCEAYWGSFVAFLNDSLTRRRIVLRSVGAGAICYRLRRVGVDLFFSDMADLAALDRHRRETNLHYLRAFLRESSVVARATGLAGVSEVLAGERVVIGCGATQHEAVWNPVDHCEGDGTRAAQRLRVTTEACVQAWASCHEDLVLQLSGGFDSAVVLGCLQRMRLGPRITSLNRFGSEPGEDERKFARCVARRAGVPLVEWPLNIGNVRFGERLGMIPVAPKPTVPALLLSLASSQRVALAQAGTSVCWSGQGGDHLFFQFPTDLIVADFVRQQGLASGVCSVVRDAARLTRHSYASLFALALATRLGAEAPRGVEGLERHPWIVAADGLGPAKRLQVAALLELLNRHAPCVRDVCEVHPLISQPLIEVCLSIPLWVALNGGRSRALARHAFADLLPRCVRERETKGTTSLYLLQVVRAQAHFICEVLREGALAREHLTDDVGWDAAALERHFRRGQPLRQDQLKSLLACVAAEIWLRQISVL